MNGLLPRVLPIRPQRNVRGSVETMRVRIALAPPGEISPSSGRQRTIPSPAPVRTRRPIVPTHEHQAGSTRLRRGAGTEAPASLRLLCGRGFSESPRPIAVARCRSASVGSASSSLAAAGLMETLWPSTALEGVGRAEAREGVAGDLESESAGVRRTLHVIATARCGAPDRGFSGERKESAACRGQATGATTRGGRHAWLVNERNELADAALKGRVLGKPGASVLRGWP